MRNDGFFAGVSGTAAGAKDEAHNGQENTDAVARNVVFVEVKRPAVYFPINRVARQLAEFGMEFKATYGMWEMERKRLQKTLPGALRRLTSRKSSSGPFVSVESVSEEPRSDARPATAATEQSVPVAPIYVRIQLEELAMRVPLIAGRASEPDLREPISFLVRPEDCKSVDQDLRETVGKFPVCDFFLFFASASCSSFFLLRY
jgi:hypothetical protein